MCFSCTCRYCFEDRGPYSELLFMAYVSEIRLSAYYGIHTACLKHARSILRNVKGCVKWKSHFGILTVLSIESVDKAQNFIKIQRILKIILCKYLPYTYTMNKQWPNMQICDSKWGLAKCSRPMLSVVY